jgi:hypothetical protein
MVPLISVHFSISFSGASGKTALCYTGLSISFFYYCIYNLVYSITCLYCTCTWFWKLTNKLNYWLIDWLIGMYCYSSQILFILWVLDKSNLLLERKEFLINFNSNFHSKTRYIEQNMTSKLTYDGATFYFWASEIDKKVYWHTY